MPRGREALQDYINRLQERINRVPDDEPWSQIRFPRQEAKRNIRNERKSKRIVITTDEQNFSEFHAIREAYMHYCEENPTLVGLAIISAMKAFDLKSWLEEQADAAHVMGTNLQNCE